MEKLPREIIIDIFSFLDKNDLLQASLVCGEWSLVIGKGDEKEGLIVWKEKCLKAWKRKMCRIEEYNGDWKRMCYHDNLINKASSWQWQLKDKDCGIGIYGDSNKVAVFHSMDNDRQVLCSTPCVTPERYYIEFRITYTQRGALNIGLATANANKKQRCGCDGNGWSLSLYRGELFHQNNWRPFTSKMETGDRVGMAVDMKKKEVYFFCNGFNLGLAFSAYNLAASETFPDELFPSVSFGDAGDCVTIIENPPIPDF